MVTLRRFFSELHNPRKPLGRMVPFVNVNKVYDLSYVYQAQKTFDSS